MTPYYQDEAVAIYHGDCRAVLPTLRGDVMIVDPPYDERTHKGARSHGEIVSKIDFEPFDTAATLPLLLAATKRWVVAFCTMEMIAGYMAIAGDRWIRAGFWRRPDGAPQFTGDRPGTPGDAIAIMHVAGKKRWNGGGNHAFWECGVERENRVHPAQKPARLMEMLVADFTDAGDLILDPFMGSGTTLVAAKRLGRKAIGIEISEAYCEIAAKRLAQGALDLFAAEATR